MSKNHGYDSDSVHSETNDKSTFYNVNIASPKASHILGSRPDEKSSQSSLNSEEHQPEGTWVDGKFIRNKGLNWFITGLFIIGDMAGGVPTAMIQSGFYFGLFCVVFVALMTCYTSICLGESWNILQKHWKEYEHHCRKPYSEIAYRAMGPFMRKAVSVCIDVTQFGIAVVYLLLASKNISNLLKAFFDFNVSFCLLVLIVAVLLLPVTFLKSPQDFWWAVVSAMVTTTIAVILITVGSMEDSDTCRSHDSWKMPDFQIKNYFVALGTFFFAYGGHSSLPTIQHDMKKPSEFTKSSIFGFIGIFALYIPAGVSGWYAYGDALRDNVIDSLQTAWIQRTVSLCITIHLILALTIVFSPLFQEIEELFKVPQKFGPKRVVTRTLIMVAVVFVAESVPTFGPLLDLIGSTTVMATSLMLPVLFYSFLVARDNMIKDVGRDIGRSCTFSEYIKYCPKPTLIICIVIFFLGFIGGGASAYSAILELSTTQFAKPCYISVFEKSIESSSSAHVNCCGPFRNLTHSGVNPATFCIQNLTDFYG
uniref:Aa_trans domain-containing protein n=1 Tax=Rhabditophanes sp. KR3021 TaxID=114890 RepID=A0AC35U383_9BILA